MYICMHICSHTRLFLPYVLYTVWFLSKSYAHTNNCKQQLEEKRKVNKIKTQQQKLGTNVRVRG
jgi:cell division protein FtsB